MQDIAYVQGNTDQHEAKAFAAYPLAQLAAAFALGILGGRFFQFRISFLITLAAVTTALAVMALLCRMKLSLATLFVTVATLFLGSSLAVIENDHVPANQLRRLIGAGQIPIGEPVELTGTLE